ncbi:MAG: hypothetical protein RUMPE_00455 [Eubacteriales bacterium SKADARSKE-1]|nr:hypothetical protein [Eubacteriales bacterium SKADARSKE-1]
MTIKNKWLFSMITVLVIIVSMLLGWLILGNIFKPAYIVWKCNDNVCTADLICGKIEGFTGSMDGQLKPDDILISIDQLKACTEGINNNKDAIDAMEHYINSHGGMVVSSTC